VRFLAAVWEQVYGLLVEDGQIAVGTLAAFAATFAWASLVGEPLRDLAGPILFVLLMTLLLVNLYIAGREEQARRTRE